MNSDMWVKLLPKEELCLRTLQIGQAFRWRQIGQEWVCAFDQLVILKEQDNQVYYLDNGAKDFVEDYFQVKESYTLLKKEWSKDKNFRIKCQDLEGIRVLRQPQLENIFSFICSANNNIPRITMMVENLCREYGPLVGSYEGEDFYGFPPLEKLAQDGVEERLRELGFGYRAKYIHKTAQMLLEKDDKWLPSLREMPYEECKQQLLELSGVGPKVADCICLMSMDKPQALPVDTHVWTIATRDYNITSKHKSLTQKTYDAIGKRFLEIFGPKCGWAHTILFAAELPQQRKRKAQDLEE
ncbi:DNA glycosylase [Gorgonomyces haynaldii]|nr:DNA glycosylase [Gorgonomyces haynaldii]